MKIANQIESWEKDSLLLSNVFRVYNSLKLAKETSENINYLENNLIRSINSKINSEIQNNKIKDVEKIDENEVENESSLSKKSWFW